MADIQDFGKKIGGARKDVWKSRGIMYSDISEMNEMERQTHVKKDNVWLRPNWEEVIAAGVPQSVAYWQNFMRQSIPPKPIRNDEETLKNYIETVCKIRDLVMAVKEPYQIDSFYKDAFAPAFTERTDMRYYVSVLPQAQNVVNNKVLKAAQASRDKMKREAEKKLFGIPKDKQVYVSTKNSMTVFKYDDETVQFDKDSRHPDDTILLIRQGWGRSYYYLRGDNPFKDIAVWEKGTYFIVNSESRKPLKININSREEAIELIEEYANKAQEIANEKGTTKETGQKRKGAFIPPQLQHVNRVGPDYRGRHHAESDMFLNDLKFRGGEFGNWLNSSDRQVNLDMAYDALRDLARILKIRPEDIALNGSLAIAFGARGRGGSGAGAAHYEPDRQVINLTKMSGAGCLAHEWGHALDHAIGINAGMTGLASESRVRGTGAPQAFVDIIYALKYKKVERTPEEMKAELQPQIERAERALKSWVNSVKPKELPPEKEKLWNEAVAEIISTATRFNGMEYQSSYNPRPVPEVEVLSMIRKDAVNRVIPKDTKIQITLWAAKIGGYLEQLNKDGAVQRTVDTDFYKGSKEFDKAFSKAGHGYWQSDCEMFARAFDCYIADKLKEAGCQSDYLSGHADSFVMPGEDGKIIAAIPQGEERKLINEKFDILFNQLKELNILHDYVEPERSEPVAEKPSEPSRSEEPKTLRNSAPVHTHSEQLSFEDLLFNAEMRANNGNIQENNISWEQSR